MRLGLEGRVAVVSGASRGIGRRIAVDLATEGCRVVACGRDEAALAATIAAAGAGDHRAVAGDLADPGEAQRIVAAAHDAFGRLDILVNNAGGNTPKKLAALTAADWQDGFEQNFFSAARLAVAAVPAMQANRWGRIVNVASTYGREPDPYFGPYSAAKAALINLSKNLSKAFTADGICTNCVIPGVTRTELVDANAAAAAGRIGTTVDEVMDRMMAKDPVAAGRFGDVGEVAAAVLFLASEQAAWISGACLAVDGGTLRSA